MPVIARPRLEWADDTRAPSRRDGRRSCGIVAPVLGADPGRHRDRPIPSGARTPRRSSSSSSRCSSVGCWPTAVLVIVGVLAGATAHGVAHPWVQVGAVGARELSRPASSAATGSASAVVVLVVAASIGRRAAWSRTRTRSRPSSCRSSSSSRRGSSGISSAARRLEAIARAEAGERALRERRGARPGRRRRGAPARWPASCTMSSPTGSA